MTKRFWLLMGLSTMPRQGHAAEESDFEAVPRINDLQIRQHAPYLAAEVVLDAIAEDAGNQSFPVLAGCIFERAPDALDPAAQRGLACAALTTPKLLEATP